MLCYTSKSTCLSATLLLIFVVVLTVGAQPTTRLDYQKVAEGAFWGWRENPGGPVRGAGKYTLQITIRPNDPLRFAIFDGTKELYTWQGSIHSIYQVAGDNLYYVDSFFTDPGGIVVAVELTSGKVLWRSPLKALSDLPAARNNFTRFNMDVQPPVITIIGWETSGKYIEIKDVKTGETVGHKIYPRDAGN